MNAYQRKISQSRRRFKSTKGSHSETTRQFHKRIWSNEVPHQFFQITFLVHSFSSQNWEITFSLSPLYSQCRSPYIVFFFGACIRPVPVMVLQYCSRGSLFSVLKSKEQITWPLVIRVRLFVFGLSFSVNKKEQMINNTFCLFVEDCQSNCSRFAFVA
jgi:hypothetical protein